MRFTIFGVNGFIGRHLHAHLVSCGHEVVGVGRETPVQRDQSLGHVIYAIGLTGDFRRRPFETVEAHVSLLARLLQSTSFDSWLYLSSTRVYGCLDPDRPTGENSAISLLPSSDSLYDLSKLLGEALCLAFPKKTVRAARLSNVYGADQSNSTFLGALISDLKARGEATILEAPESSKDYVSIDDVVQVLPEVAMFGRERLYNIASGSPTTHLDLVKGLRAKYQNSDIAFEPGGAVRKFPRIDITRIKEEFKFRPRNVILDLG